MAERDEDMKPRPEHFWHVENSSSLLQTEIVTAGSMGPHPESSDKCVCLQGGLNQFERGTTQTYTLLERGDPKPPLNVSIPEEYFKIMSKKI